MELKNFEGMNYYISMPKSAEKPCPLILFLHGAGTRGEDPSIILGNAFVTITNEKENFPFIRVMPHCNGLNTWFDFGERLKRFVLYLASLSAVDEEQIFVMGNSMGGYGTWALGESIPHLLAGIVPICGGGKPWNSGMLVSTPVWAFHGKDDDVVDVVESIKMCESINAMGGRARLTLYDNTYHDSWTATYKSDEVFSWLLTLRNEKAKKFVNNYNGSENFG